MKTTDQTSDRITTNTKSPVARWYRVRPVLRWTLSLSVAAWVGLVAPGAVRGIGSQGMIEGAARIVAQQGSLVLNVLAAASVAAVIVKGARTPGEFRKLRRKLARSLRVTQRLIPGSRTARA